MASPKITLPPGEHTVDVSIINTTSTIICPLKAFVENPFPGHDTIRVPAYSFLIHNPVLKRTVLFDLGVRKDPQNLAPRLMNRLQSAGFGMEIEKNVRDILDEHGENAEAIEAIIWSHAHFDHTGDPSTFGRETALVVGPGFRDTFMPGYPTNPQGQVLDSDWQGRDVRQVSFGSSNCTVGRFPALDYFGDGSFYLLDSPGHCVGHMCAFARISSGRTDPDSDSDSFLFLGADCIHHDGELRPNPWTPLPDQLSPDPLQGSGVSLGDLAARLLPHGSRTEAFYQLATRGAHHDPVRAVETIEKTQELDALENVLFVSAHDPALLSVADFFPKRVNDFVGKGWKSKMQWEFLADFIPAVRD